MNLIDHEIDFLRALAYSNLSADEFGVASMVCKDMQAMLDGENPATIMLCYHNDSLQDWLQSWYDNWWQYASGDVEDLNQDQLDKLTAEAFDNLIEAYKYAFGDKYELLLHCAKSHDAKLHEALNS